MEPKTPASLTSVSVRISSLYDIYNVIETIPGLFLRSIVTEAVPPGAPVASETIIIGSVSALSANTGVICETARAITKNSASILLFKLR